jgi:hypothetical protein
MDIRAFAIAAFLLGGLVSIPQAVGADAPPIPTHGWVVISQFQGPKFSDHSPMIAPSRQRRRLLPWCGHGRGFPGRRRLHTAGCLRLHT